MMKVNAIFLIAICVVWSLITYSGYNPYSDDDYLFCIIFQILIFAVSFVPAGIAFWLRVYDESHRRKAFSDIYLVAQLILTAAFAIYFYRGWLFSTENELCHTETYFQPPVDEAKKAALKANGTLPPDPMFHHSRTILMEYLKGRYHSEHPEKDLCIGSGYHYTIDTNIGGRGYTWVMEFECRYNQGKVFVYSCLCNDDTCITMQAYDQKTHKSIID